MNENDVHEVGTANMAIHGLRLVNCWLRSAKPMLYMDMRIAESLQGMLGVQC